LAATGLKYPTPLFRSPRHPVSRRPEDLCRSLCRNWGILPVSGGVAQCRWGWSAKPKTAPNTCAAAQCRFRFVGITSSCYSFMQKPLGIFENLQPLRRQVLASAIDVERQHAHSGRRSLGRYLPGRQLACDCLRILVEQTRTRVGGIRVHRCRPLTSSAGVAVRAAVAGIFCNHSNPHISWDAVQSSKE
jgi:hypothetical protein